MTVTSRGDNGILFEGEKGKLFVNRGKITGAPIEENWDEDQFTEADVMALYKGKPFEGHKNNFYRCIREGGLPVSDVLGSGGRGNHRRRAGPGDDGPHAPHRLRDPAGVGASRCGFRGQDARGYVCRRAIDQRTPELLLSAVSFR